MLTGKKFKNKIYYRHTGYPGGIKQTNPKEMIEKGKSTDIIKYAIKRMIPKGPLGSKQLSNCKIYPSPEHPHSSQNPKMIKLSDLNNLKELSSELEHNPNILRYLNIKIEEEAILESNKEEDRSKPISNYRKCYWFRAWR